MLKRSMVGKMQAMSITSTICVHGGTRDTNRLPACLARRIIVLINHHGEASALASGSVTVITRLQARSSTWVSLFSTSGNGGGIARRLVAPAALMIWGCLFAA